MNMSKQKSNKNPTTFLPPVLFVFLIPIVYILTGKIDHIGPRSFFEVLIKDHVTLLIILVMLVVLLLDALCSRKKLNDITKALRDAAQEINNKKPISDIASSCKNNFLKKCLYEYNSDSNKVLKDSGIYPDISSYINEQIIADATHQAISNQISNAMTGLGILGTFLGLVIGLEDFNVNNLSEISILINGIKTAFYTSIFGVLASIIYSHCYNMDLENNNAALEEFYSCFYNTISANPDITFYNEVIKHNENEADLLAKAISPIFADLITKSVTPVMNKLNSSIDSYIIKAVEAQSSTLKMLVDNFMVQLNKSMDDQFYALSHSIRDMCTWQNESVEKTKLILSSIEEITESLSMLNVDIKETEEIRSAINKETNELINEANDYVKEFKLYTDALKAWTVELKNETEKSAECSKNLKEFSENQNTAVKNTIEQLNGVILQFEKYKEETDKNIAKHEADNSNMLKTLNDITNRFDTYVKEINNEIKLNISKNEQAIDKLTTYNGNFIRSTEFIGGQFAVLENNIRDIYNELQEEYKNQDDLLSKTFENFLNEVKSLKNISNSAEKAINQGMSNIIDSNNKVITEKILPAINSVSNKINQRGNEK